MKQKITQITILISIILIVTPGSFAQLIKKYAAKTGKITYKIDGNTKGTETLYWNDYGDKEYRARDIVTKSFGTTTKEVRYELTIGDVVHSWQKDKKEGSTTKNPFLTSLKEDPDYTWEEFGDKMLDAFSYKKIGTETITGKKCDIYDGSLGKLWFWQGLALKTEAKLLGIKTIQTASEVKTGISVPKEKFSVPQNIEFEKVDINAYNELIKSAIEADAQSESENTQEKKNTGKDDEDVMDKDIEITKKDINNAADSLAKGINRLLKKLR